MTYDIKDIYQYGYLKKLQDLIKQAFHCKSIKNTFFELQNENTQDLFPFYTFWKSFIYSPLSFYTHLVNYLAPGSYFSSSSSLIISPSSTVSFPPLSFFLGSFLPLHFPPTSLQMLSEVLFDFPSFCHVMLQIYPSSLIFPKLSNTLFLLPSPFFPSLSSSPIAT